MKLAHSSTISSAAMTFLSNVITRISPMLGKFSYYTIHTFDGKVDVAPVSKPE
jgi:hypothetical protein